MFVPGIISRTKPFSDVLGRLLNDAFTALIKKNNTTQAANIPPFCILRVLRCRRLFFFVLRLFFILCNISTYNFIHNNVQEKVVLGSSIFVSKYLCKLLKKLLPLDNCREILGCLRAVSKWCFFGLFFGIFYPT